MNALGQTVTSSDPNGTTHTVGYDILGRVVTDTVTTLGSGVDGSVRRVETAYDSQGHASLLTSYDAVSSGSVVNQVQRDYNGLGQLTSEWQAHGSYVGSTTPRVQYGYSEMAGGANHSRLTSMTYPNGRVISYDYGLGLNASISRLDAMKDGSTTLEAYSYLGLGTVVVRAHPESGVSLTYVKQSGESNGEAGDPYTGLDRFGRIVDQRWLNGSGTATDRFQYSYDRDGNRLTRNNLINSDFDESYGYDGLNQVVSFDRGTSRSQDWSYDALGNWSSVTTDGTTQTRSVNAQNEITGISGATTPTYSAAGEMTGDETGRQFVYDAWHRLVKVKNSNGATLETFTYDPLGRRVTQTVGRVTTDLYYSTGWQVLEEKVGGVAKTQYVWSPVYVDALIERDRDADGSGGNGLEERLWVQQDANWNVTVLVNGSGVVQERMTFDAFGMAQVRDVAWAVKTGGTGFAWEHLFQGMAWDATTGLYGSTRLRGSGYSPTLGRWITPDPKGLGPDINFYRFILNSPVNDVDPMGTQPPSIGKGPQLGLPGPSHPGPNAWQYDLNQGPRLIDGKRVSYQIWIDLILPKDRPKDATQIWQVNKRTVFAVKPNCEIVKKTEYIVDVVDIGKRNSMRVTLATLDNDPYCFYYLTVEKTHGFNPVGEEYAQENTGKTITERLANQLLGKMRVPVGVLTYNYIYYNVKNCSKCCPILEKLGLPKNSGETLSIPLVGVWTASAD